MSLQNEMSLNFHMIEIKAPIRLIQVSLLYKTTYVTFNLSRK